jgi:HD-GYP domain-containing protein (c-di-GMP phosphodiesterase class II)
MKVDIRSNPQDIGLNDIRLAVTADGRMRADMLRLVGLDGRYRTIRLEQLEAMDTAAPAMIIIDLDLENQDILKRIISWKKNIQGQQTILIFTVIPEQRAILLENGLIIDANVVNRPLNRFNFNDLIERLLLPGAVSGTGQNALADNLYTLFPDQAEALRTGDQTLANIFELTSRMTSISQRAIEKRSITIVGSLAENGVARWTEAVRSHHNLTYQHCLLVTGSAISFGQHLGFSDCDLTRLATGAMLHDLGKAEIPVTILDKPSALTSAELASVQQHPLAGFKALSGNPEFTPEMLDLVLHHHEYLDGSGYPDKLDATSIPDLTRLITIADVFAALIEKRAYKNAMSGEKAFEIMQSMTGKLDMQILRAVGSVAKAIPAAGI